MFLKGLIAAALESSERLHLGLMRVSAPSLHRESTDSMIYIYICSIYSTCKYIYIYM